MSSNGVKLEVKGVGFCRGGRSILSDVNWRIATGEHWALLGANGSGKTTLLQIAMGYLWPSVGEVAVLGEAYGQVDLRLLRRRIGYVSASLGSQIRPDQKAMNVVLSGAFASTALFDKPTSRQRDHAARLVEQLGCTRIGDSRFGQLSLGEQQRILIARALMARPELLILDEPCAGLDLSAREGLLSGVQKMAGNGAGVTLVLVTHHIEEIPPAITHAMLLRDGQVIAQGPKGKVLTAGCLSRTFGLPIEVDQRHDRYWLRVRGV
jgi:iron complex transport system ATP-binding protein